MNKINEIKAKISELEKNHDIDKRIAKNYARYVLRGEVELINLRNDLINLRNALNDAIVDEV